MECKIEKLNLQFKKMAFINPTIQNQKAMPNNIPEISVKARVIRNQEHG